ncbi:carboxypeptidase-like regulatory domain-containing protein [Flavobacterium sp.]|uniref:carboxypeptidase-like regulatory domain-containing protein n=1 Tax=Flavobacterium sp. TaxID=239 RepID=UPI0039E39986
MKKLVISTLFVMQVVLAFAQTGTGVSGKVVDSKTQQPLQNVVATIQNTNLTQLTDATGKFTFSDIAAGNQLLQIKTQGYKEQLLQVEIVKGKILDLGIVVLEEDQTEEQQLSLITITENDLGDDNSGSESTAGLLQASRDAFQQTAAFNWGQARYRIRGLDNEYATTMINGVVMNKIYDGRPQWSNWGGLNDATRNQEFTTGSAPSDYTFGGILGTQEINTRASIYRPGSRISFAGTNTNYNWRVMGTHASGMNTNGWAFVVSAGRRWADEGYFEGTDYAAASLFASVEKKFNSKHSLNLTAIYAQNSRGKNSPNSQETIDLKGEKYNSYWGWQDGKKRNSRDKDVEEPIIMLSHFWKISPKTNLNTNVTFQTGHIANTRLDYNGGNNPDPTYYKNLPSYWLNYHYDNNLDDPFNVPVWQPDYIKATGALGDFMSNSQINWDRMYAANKDNGRAIYALYEDRTEDDLITVNSILSSQLADNISFNGGATFRSLRSENFQKMIDLLGDNPLIDTDSFYEGAEFSEGQNQSDLNNPNRAVYEGDRYGYNYILYASTLDAFTQFKFTYKKIDFYLAQNYTRTEYQRDGLYRNGLYANNSYGKSEKAEFDNFGFKGGMTYKLSGRSFFNVNAVYMTKAPSLRNTFTNARLNNNILDGLESETVSGADVSYILNAPKFKARLTGYYSMIQNATKIGFFYSEGLSLDDDSGEDEFVAEITQGMDKRNLGAELGMEYQVTSTIKLTGSAAYGQYIYNNNPNVSLSVDGRQAAGLNPVVNFGQSYMKNYKQGGMPQQAYSFGVEYRDPHFWWVGVNGNYLADSYVDIDPLLRTNNFYQVPNQGGITFPEATPERADFLLKQEKFDPFYLVNLTGGKSWRIKGKTVGFFASVNNVLDEVYKTGGFESARNANYREINEDNASGTRAFGNRYFFGYGRTYFVNLYINF